MLIALKDGLSIAYRSGHTGLHGRLKRSSKVCETSSVQLACGDRNKSTHRDVSCVIRRPQRHSTSSYLAAGST